MPFEFDHLPIKGLVLIKAKVALKDIITLTGISRATVFRVLQASKPDGSPKKNGNKPVGRPRKQL